MTVLDDLESLDDEALNEVIDAARRIIARRAATAAIPAQIEGLAREYRESGGEQSTLIEAITEPTEQES